MTLWKDKVTLQKVGVTSMKDRNVININSTTKGKCPQGVCSGEGEYITHHNCSNGNDLDMNLATMCDCSREFNSLRGLQIHKVRWCKRRNSPTGEYRSNDGLMNQEYPHSVQEPIAERQCPGDIPSKPRIQWPKGNQKATRINLNQELSFLLTTHLKGPIDQQVTSFCRVIYDVCLEWFGEVTHKKEKNEGKRPNRQQIQKGKLRSEQRMLKCRLKVAPIHERVELQNILNDIQNRILVISRAKNQRKHRKKKCQARRSFYSNPHAFTKKLFVESKSGKFDVPKEELKNHLKMTYSDDLNGIPIPPLRDLPKPQDPMVMFDDNWIKLKVIWDFVNKARAGSAPGMNGIPYKLYKNCPHVLRKLIVLLQLVRKKGIVQQEWCLTDGIWIPKEMQSRGITNFRTISLLNVEGKIFFWVLARRMTTFLMSDHYINTSIQKAGIPGFPRCLEHSQMIWNSILSAKRDKTELHGIWLDLANAYDKIRYEVVSR